MEKTYKIGTKIYNKKIIKQAIEDFKDVSKIEYKVKSGDLIILGKEIEDIEETFNEFMNYLIYLEC